jgi:hypothetical protein
MRQAFDHALNSFLGAAVVAADLVADFEDGAPILGGQILVRRLG